MGGGGGVRWVGQGGCEWRSKFCENSKKKILRGGGVRSGIEVGVARFGVGG